MGMPDISDNKDYYSAVSAGSKFMSKGLFGGTTEFYKFVNTADYPYYNIRAMQNELKELQQKYEKMVRDNKTDRFLGIFGSTIESTGKQIDQVKAKLQKAWGDMEKALSAAKAKAAELNSSINTEKAKIEKLQKELDGMDIYDSANASKVQEKMKEIKKCKEVVEDAQDKLEQYDKLKKVFK
jgi:chromosome segregation ATPase